MSLHWCPVETRLGRFLVASHDGRIACIKLPGSDEAALWQTLAGMFPGEAVEAGLQPVLGTAAVQLQEYAEGLRTHFDLPLELNGTDFQKKVWQALLDVPFGETRSYGDLAAAVGKPGAARAVGGANRANHLPVVVPCHRVLAADGSIGGYMGDWGEEAGTAFKRRLLELEEKGKMRLTV